MGKYEEMYETSSAAANLPKPCRKRKQAISSKDMGAVPKPSIDEHRDGSPPAGIQTGFESVMESIKHLSSQNQDIEMAQKSARDKNMEKELQREYKLRFYNDLHEQID